MLTAKSINTLNSTALVGAIALAGWVGYDLYSRYMDNRANPQEFSFASDSSARLRAPLNMTNVIEAHLFGVIPQRVVNKPVVQAKPAEDAPKTRLKLNLTGLVSGERGMAMIEIKRGETTVVKVGQEIGKTGAILQSVESDHILIDRNGTIEKLQMEREVLEMSVLTDSNEQTISALNISEAELNRLAQQDAQIQKQYQQELAQQQQAAAALAEATAKDNQLPDTQTPEQVLQRELDEELKRQLEEEAELQPAQSQEQQIVFKQAENAPAKKKVPGALKRL